MQPGRTVLNVKFGETSVTAFVYASSTCSTTDKWREFNVVGLAGAMRGSDVVVGVCERQRQLVRQSKQRGI